MPLRKSQIVAARARKEAHSVLQALAYGDLDVYEGYRQLYRLWVSRNAAVQELRPLFRMPGVDTDGIFSIDEPFRNDVIRIAKEILPLLQLE